MNPSLLIFLETEIWPTLLREAYRKGLSTLLLSGRLSAKSLKRYAPSPAFFRRVLQCYSAIGMQSHEDAERILELGAEKRRLFVIGNLKRAPAATQVDANGKRVKNGRKPQARRKGPLLVVGSSHRGEEEILLNVFIPLKAVFSDLQLALAPRHPQRFSEVGQLLRAKGLDFECLSQQPRAGCFSHDVMLLPTTGEVWIRVVGMLVAFLGLYYRVAAAAELVPIFRMSVLIRLSVPAFFLLFVLAGWSRWPLLLFGLADAAGAAWTWQALRARTS